MMKSRAILEVKIDDIQLNPSDKLAYESPEQQRKIEKMAEHLREEGQLEPIRLTEDLAVLDGHLRYFAASRLGWKVIKAIMMSVEEF